MKDSRAYPRGRGGNSSRRTSGSPCRGLSPRTRGKQGRLHRKPRRAGPIPADAGETRPDGQYRRGPGAYPRGRGGNNGQIDPGGGEGGLSPRTRGKRLRCAVRHTPVGPIPADAGETLPCDLVGLVDGAYPRGRGGNEEWALKAGCFPGLSPRTRGKRCRRSRRGSSPGPIPADAGETPPSRHLLERSRAYPRGRGGNGWAASLTSARAGLSPRTRGKRGARADGAG
ncbi:Uncharacterized protein pbN1_19710 [Aromatoleum bremense]|nr:Uncharacterized protein pbN1_19710 [Aromatoleum bremense]